MLTITLITIILAMIAVFIRLIRGKTIWIKLLSLNLFAVQVTMLIITYAVYINSPLVMDIAMKLFVRISLSQICHTNNQLLVYKLFELNLKKLNKLLI